MAASGIHGKSLEITVVGCSKLRDTEWFCRQDPYVCLKYASTKFCTNTCTDGGRKAQFHEKFVLTLIEGLREVEVSVFNKNKVQLDKVLLTGFDDNSWPLQSGSGRPATNHASSYGVAPPPVSPYGVAPSPSVPPHGVAPPVSPYGVAHVSLPQNSQYPYGSPSQSTYAPPQARPSPNPYRPQQVPAYPPPPPPSQGVYPHSQYTPPPPRSNYPPSPYPPPPSSNYTPSPYPAPPSTHSDPSPYPHPPLGYPASPYPPLSSTYPDPSSYPHPSRDVEPESESSHFNGDYRYDHEY